MSKTIDQETIEKLKKELSEHQKLMTGYSEVFDKNFSKGFEHAVVLRSEKTMVQRYQKEVYGDFRLTSEVTISPESQFSHMPGYPDTVGKIVGFDPEGYVGWAEVDFGDKKPKVFRYGHPDVADGACDLILIGEPLNREHEETVVTIISNGVISDVMNPLGVTLAVGDTVLVSRQTQSIVMVTKPVKGGIVADVEEVLADGLIVSVNGAKRFVYQGSTVGQCTRADRVLLDASQIIALSLLPRSQSIAITSDMKPFNWDDVIGLEDAKEKILSVVNAVEHPDIFAAFQKDSPSGILLVGSPGNGKTVLGKATASLIAKKFGQGTNGVIKNFIYIKASEILDMYVGEGPRKVREIFDLAESRFKETGIKTIIFIDEIDAVGKKRGGSNDSGSSDSITNSFLMEMDGIQKSYGIVIGATNRADILDPAFLRPGRFDYIVEVRRPMGEEIKKHFELHLRKLPFEKGQDLESMVAHAAAQYCDDAYALYDVWFPKDGVEFKPNLADDQLEKVCFKLCDIGSGATIMGIVEKAKDEAVKRSIKIKEVSPLTLADITAATGAMFKERILVDHEDEIKEFADAQGKDSVRSEKKF